MAFQAFDLNADGWLSHEELHAGILGLDIGLTRDEVSELVLQVCVARSLLTSRFKHGAADAPVLTARFCTVLWMVFSAG